MSVSELFRHGVQRFADTPFLTDATGTISYAEAEAEVVALAKALRASGAATGARVALLCRNSAAAMLAILGVYRAGCVFVPLNAAFPIEAHLGALDGLKVAALLFDSHVAGELYAVADRLAGLTLVCIDGAAAIGVSRQAFVAAGTLTGLEEPRGHADDVSAIYPTGGSTGRPKRVMHTHLTWDTMAASFHTALTVAPRPVYLMVSPITHAAGTFALLLTPLGVHVIVQDGFQAGAVLAAIERDCVTHLFLPPTAIYKLLADPLTPGCDFGSLRAFIYSAAPMSIDKLRECFSTFGPVMVQFWGQMEAPSVLTCLTAQDHLDALVGDGERLGSCGRETLFTRIGVMDGEGRLLGPAERGELVVRGNLVMAGYHDNPAATQAASRFDWHHTGDLGFKDEAGYVYIVGRESDMIITGGFNVYPVDVEQVLWSHPAVEECAVIGVPHEVWGEAVHAVVQLKPDGRASAQELIALCRTRLGAVRTPKSVELRDELPRNAVGKIDKVALRRPFWSGRARSV